MLLRSPSLYLAAQSERTWTYLLVGFAASLKLNLVGEIYVGELMGILYSIYLLSKLRIGRIYAMPLGLAITWALMQTLSDGVNQTELTDSLKGVFAPLVFVLTFHAIGNHFSKGNERRIWYFVAGVALGAMLEVAWHPSADALINPWKMGYAMYVLALLLAYLSIRRPRVLKLVVGICAYCAFSAVMDFRSAAGIPLIGLLIYLCRRSVPVRFAARVAAAPGGIAVIFAFTGLAITLLNMLLSAVFAHSAEFGFLSPEVVKKYTVQATSDLGMLLAGRTEALISWQAFLDAPLLGHGSWAQDHNGYSDRMAVLVYQMNAAIEDRIDETTNTLIPAHSFLFAGLVWSGIAGGLFWVAMLGKTMRIFLRNIQRMPIYFFVGMGLFLWDVFFSPFSADHRWGTAVFVGMLFAWDVRSSRGMVSRSAGGGR